MAVVYGDHVLARNIWERDEHTSDSRQSGTTDIQSGISHVICIRHPTGSAEVISLPSQSNYLQGEYL